MRVHFKKLFLIGTLCAITGLVSAQGFYIKAGGGYSFGAGKMSTAFFQERDINTTTDKPISLGKGINTAIGAGYMFNQYFGVELAASYQIGLDNTFNNTIPFVDEYNLISAGESQLVYKIKYSGLALTPSFKLVVPVSNKLSAYSRLGIVLPIIGKSIITIESTAPGYNSFQKIETTSFFKLGCSGAMGMSYAITDKLDIFAEVNGTWSSFQAKKSTITESTLNGVDILSTMTTREKETEFQKEYTFQSDETSNPNKPQQTRTFTLPASNIGLTIGVTFKF